MTLHAAMHAACEAVGIEPPRMTRAGQWVACPVRGKSRANRSGRVLVFDDGTGGMAFNWVSGEKQRFTAEGLAGPGGVRAPRRDPEAERARRELEQAATAAAARMVAEARNEPHPYLAAKGFPDEPGLVLDDPAALVPAGEAFNGARWKLGQMAGPFLVMPGRVGKQVVTVQLIDAEGVKWTLKGTRMKGAACRIASGRETWVCEGLATALTVRAALRLLGRSATVLAAFSAANTALVAQRIGRAVIAADHDAPQEALHGKGAGEFYAEASGCPWVQPADLGDFNDMHQRDGLRSVALVLREVRPP